MPENPFTPSAFGTGKPSSGLPITAAMAPPLVSPPWVRKISTPQGESWTAARVDWSGNIVTQVGARPSGPIDDYLWAGCVGCYSWEGTLPRGQYSFTARFKVKSVSLRPDYGVAQAFALMGFKIGSDDPRKGLAYLQEPRIVSAGAEVSVTSSRWLEANWYGLYVGLGVSIVFEDQQRPYAEVIGALTGVSGTFDIAPSATPAPADGGSGGRLRKIIEGLRLTTFEG